MTYTPVRYMDQNHPDAFLDYPGIKKPEYGHTKLCPKCKGHGGWNLRLNAYSLHNYPNTAENRHRYSHFKCMCSHCSGWGYVLPTETCPGHEWQFLQNLGRCYNRYKCLICGKTSDVDSSD